MRTSRKITWILAICVAGAAAGMVAYKEHLCKHDRREIAALIRHASRFDAVKVQRVGYGLIVKGHVRSQQDLEELFEHINRQKLGRVVCTVTVKEAIEVIK